MKQEPKLTTRLKGRPPIQSCRPDEQPNYPTAVPVLGPKGHFVYGWLRTSDRNREILLVTACEEGMARLIGAMRHTEDAVERASTFLFEYHRQRVKRILNPEDGV